MELFKINVNITDTVKLESGSATVQMILFDGYCDSSLFHGKILQGGVDTQRYFADDSGSISARYMLQGVDADGLPCKIFIENQAEVKNGIFKKTTPKILTDSLCLKWLETANLYGEVESVDGGVVIVINEVT